jgi:poly(hydroxyalkanoate) depolymerase family esterase
MPLFRKSPAGDPSRIKKIIDAALAAAGLRARGSVISAPVPRVLPPAPPIAPALPGSRAAEPAALTVAQTGLFTRHAFTNSAGTRDYKIYVPSTCSDSHALVPLVVMLHGCAQTADDFAAGTRMNELAELNGFIVAYPEQTARANGSRCWNWFRRQDQGRDGEPALIAGITKHIAATHHVDDRRIFVAGLSAGAAMAVILGKAYPELYAAVGAHSGLAFGAAHDVPSAFAAMQGQSRSTTQRQAADARSIPVIVFHGDHDRTVNERNGHAIIDDAVGDVADHAGWKAGKTDPEHVNGRNCERTSYTDVSGKPVGELWIVGGAGHAWSGGSALGSFTDQSGPDASSEMIRFFYSHAHGGERPL